MEILGYFMDNQSQYHNFPISASRLFHSNRSTLRSSTRSVLSLSAFQKSTETRSKGWSGMLVSKKITRVSFPSTWRCSRIMRSLTILSPSRKRTTNCAMRQVSPSRGSQRKVQEARNQPFSPDLTGKSNSGENCFSLFKIQKKLF